MPHPRAAAVVVATLLLGVLAGCPSRTKSTFVEELPPGGDLLKSAAAAMREVKTVRFGIETTGSVADLPLRRADGQLTREGNAQGTVQVDQGGGPVEFQFVILGTRLWLRGPTGGWQQLPLALAATVYDPSAILDPNRGIAKLLDTARDGRTEARESIDGVDTFRVAAAFDAPTVAALVPGAGEGVTGHVWVDAARKLPVRAKLALPAKSGSQPGSVTVKLSEFDAPVTVNAP
jgi:lipoprotein LprG